MNTTKKAAEILVECGYANDLGVMLGDLAVIVDTPNGFHKEIVNPFYSCEAGEGQQLQLQFECYARRQADAIEDGLAQANRLLWNDSRSITILGQNSNHQWRLDRIKWCLGELSK